ncbi:SNF2 family N-terminal domain-containing protein [Sparassis latifolia]
MSFQRDPAATKAALEQLKFKKVQRQQNTSLNHSGPSNVASWGAESSRHDAPPMQSRDATIASRYFTATPTSPGNVLVPSSSTPTSDPFNRPHPTPWPQQNFFHAIPAPTHPYYMAGTSGPPTGDPLSAPSGFMATNGAPHASFTRPWGANGRSISEVEGTSDVEPPRKRANRGPSSPRDPLDFLSTPDSPEVQRPGQRHKLNGNSVLSPTSSDESLPEIRDVLAGPSKPRIVRGHRSLQPQPQPSSSEQSQSEAEDARFTRFRLTQIEHSSDIVRAAWREAHGDVRNASELLNDPNWKPTVLTPPPRVVHPPVETGRVKEIDDTTKAQRAAVREKGKKSLIYKNRIDLEASKASSPATPLPTTFAISTSPRSSPASPEVANARPRRLKRKVVDSDSEPDYVDSDDEPSRAKRAREDGSMEVRALEYFNTASAPTLQELTGCTVEQASKIIELRPFPSASDLKAKLGQGKKRAGPAGISPRMFEDSVAIIEGYGQVDNIVEDCEQIGAELRREIASWTDTGKGKMKDTSSGSLSPNISEDGALSLRATAISADRRPKYYLTSQPSLLSDHLQLKEYQMVGVNWLNLLYRKKLSCILADEMGLGKTVQVISFLAHLKEQGRKGPHLIVVPSSTLENWCREFSNFADSIKYVTYYESKEKRPKLREELLRTQRSKKDDGWEVLITTYALAQGDEKDRKFFRHIPWDACVFDEGHVLKNFQSQRYQALLRFESRWRLLLTGTPLQNNLQELVSLMNFILPQKFAGRMESLRAVFKTKGDSKVTLLAQERVSRAKKMMTPFVLRRRKDQVLKDLPKKSERIEWCEMTPLQKSIYNEALRRSRKTVFDASANGAEVPEDPPANGRSKTAKKPKANPRPKDKLYAENSANVLMDLRKAASHPMLFRRRFTDDTLASIAKVVLNEPDFKKRGAMFQYVKEDMQVMTDAELQVFCSSYKSTRKFLQQDDCYLQAGKVKVLLTLLRRYMGENRRVLVFSQFTQVLDILRKVLDKQSVKYLVLTGSTPVDVRQTLVDEFTEDNSITVFLLSTKAGGMGINLTAASVVIMFDQDFNPHNDRQAQDRAYRIGQKQDVDVVTLITKGSIEEDMLALGQTKLALDEAVAGEGEENVEREMKTSLMNVVRKKLEAKEDDEVLTEDKGPLDVESPLSALDDESS